MLRPEKHSITASWFLQMMNSPAEQLPEHPTVRLTCRMAEPHLSYRVFLLYFPAE